jgi:AbrB family looped-hinge helix DNA binding protein
MKTIKLQQRGLLTLPKKLRDTLALEEGQILRVTQDGQKIILEPQRTSIDTELAKAITKGLADIKAGKFIEFETTAELHKKLTQYED